MVQVEDPEHMNLLGLLLQGFLSQQLTSPKLQRKAKRLKGDFGVQVGDMAVTLSLTSEALVVRKGLREKLRATVRGPLKEMVPLVTGGGGLILAVIAVLEGRIEISGNPFALLRLLPLLLKRTQSVALPPAQVSS